MTHKEEVERNIGLTFDFVDYLMDNKLELDKLPDNFKLEFIEKDFPKRQNPQKKNQTTTSSLQEQYVRVGNSFAMT
jgi:hypothetical protein